MNIQHDNTCNGAKTPLTSQRIDAGTYARFPDDDSEEITSPTANPFFSTVTTGYIQRFPRYLDVFRKLRLNAPENTPDSTIRQVHSLFASLHALILTSRIVISKSDLLPPFYISWMDDGSALVEWVFQDSGFRIGFSLEPQPEESLWYLVSNEDSGAATKSGPLPADDLLPLLFQLFEYVRLNS